MRNWIVAGIDVETSDLDPYKDHILEVGVVRLMFEEKKDYVSVKEVGGYTSMAALPKGAVVSPKAAAVNGYNPQEWAAAPPLKTVLEDMAPFMKDATLVAHNAHFDIQFLKYAFHVNNVTWPRSSYRVFDTGSQAHLYYLSEEIENSGLDALCGLFGFERGQHSAENDARLALQCYAKFVSIKLNKNVVKE